MTASTTIECVIHWVVDGREHQRALIFRDQPAALVVVDLLDRLDLREHVDGPTRSVATLRPSREAPPFADATTLAEAGVRDGDVLWLVLTPTYLPATVHWSVVGAQDGQIEALLPTSRTVGEQVGALLEYLGLRELVDGPASATAALRAAPDAPPWDEDRSLLDLGLLSGAQVWLTVAPRFMPATIRWTEDGRDLEKRRFLAVDAVIGDHLDALVGLLALGAQVRGPEKRVPSLHPGPRQPALPTDQTLPQAGVRPDDQLWFRMTSAYADVTVHYPDDSGPTARQVTLPRTQPVRQVGRQLARDLGLGGAVTVVLQPAPGAAALPAASTLADHGIGDGDQVWLALGPAAASEPLAPGVVVLAVCAALVMALMLVQAPRLAPRPAATSAAQGITAQPAAAPTGVAPLATASPGASSTPDLLLTIYDFGREAYLRQDWATAAAAFERAYAIDPGYRDVGALLADAYYNQASGALGPDGADRASELLARTLELSPTHQPGRELEQRLTPYRGGRASAEQQDWAAAVAQFEQVRALQPDFLDVTPRLYDAYIGRGAQLEQQLAEQRNVDLIPAARATYEQAAALPGVDPAAAQARVQALQPALRADRVSQDGDSTCIQVAVDGADISAWSVRGSNGRSTGFDGAGVANLCGLRSRQELLVRVVDGQGQTVPGGDLGGLRGGDVIRAPWR